MEFDAHTWEQRRLGDFLVESRIPGTNGAKAKKLTVKLWGLGVVPKNDQIQGSTATKYYIRRSGQFMYGKLDFLHAAFGIVPDNLDGFESTLDSPAFDVHDKNAVFLLLQVTQPWFYLRNGLMANGSRKAKRIHVADLLSMNIWSTTNNEESAIAVFFSLLNSNITLHQRQDRRV